MKPLKILVYAFVLVAAGLMVAALLGLPVFSSNIDDSRRGEAVGCYYLGDDMVVRVTPADLVLPGGGRIGYSIWSDETGLAILPSGRLRLRSIDNGRSQLAQVAGLADLLPFEDSSLNRLKLTTIGRFVRVADKRPCPQLR
jgi:hypothetical protein